MYDPLKHYIAEGTVILHSYPHPEDFKRTRGRFIKIGDVGMTANQPMGPLGGYELRVQHKNVWFVYQIDDDFYDEYTIRVRDRQESEELEKFWKAEYANNKNLANLNELVS